MVAQRSRSSLLLAGAGGGDEDGVVAGDRADDLGPVGLVDGDATLCAAPVMVMTTARVGPAAGAAEECAPPPAVRRSGRRPPLRHQVAARDLRRAEVAQVPADRGLRRLETARLQERGNFFLAVHPLAAQQLEDLPLSLVP